MSTTFFQNMDFMFQEKLDHPVPAVMLEANKQRAVYLRNLEKSSNREDYDFTINLPEGQVGEEYVKDFLIMKGYEFVRFNRISKDKKFYDLVMRITKNGETKEVLFEIKVDFKAGFKKNGGTGNLAIEEKSRGKDSGITTTKADFYVYINPNENVIGFIKVDKLKKLIDELKSKNIGRMHNDSGDIGSNTICYLMPYEHFLSNFKVNTL